MIAPTEPQVATRLKQALAAFQKAQELMLTAHRKLKGTPQEDTERFWSATGARLEKHLHTCATEVIAAYRPFSAAGGIAAPDARRLVNEAHQLLVRDADQQAVKPKVDFNQRNAELEASKRLRVAIEAELEHRGIRDLAEIATLLGLSTRLADRLMRRSKWLEGDLALLQAAAARLGLTV